MFVNNVKIMAAKNVQMLLLALNVSELEQDQIVLVLQIIMMMANQGTVLLLLKINNKQIQVLLNC